MLRYFVVLFCGEIFLQELSTDFRNALWMGVGIAVGIAAAVLAMGAAGVGGRRSAGTASVQSESDDFEGATPFMNI